MHKLPTRALVLAAIMIPAASQAQSPQFAERAAGIGVAARPAQASSSLRRFLQSSTRPLLLAQAARPQTAPSQATTPAGEEKPPAPALTSPASAPAVQAAPTTGATQSVAGSRTGDTPLVAAGGAIFLQNCAFCHGRDAGGGETGPDLTRSKLVAADVNGDKISEVLHNGRAEKGMPRFAFNDSEMSSVVAFIHSQVTKSLSKAGGRRGVDVSDLQTGNLEAGKAYFNGAGGCTSCHSPTGNLAGIATKYQGLQLEQRMLYPRDVKSKVTITLPTGKTIDGTLAYQDEFTIGLRDSSGTYRSWSRSTVKDQIESPVDAHVAQFPKYTDDDIHNLMAYLQTLR